MPNPTAPILDTFSVNGTPPPGWAKTSRSTTGEGLRENAFTGTCRLPVNGPYSSIYWTAETFGPNCEVWVTFGGSYEGVPDFEPDTNFSILLRLSDPTGTPDGYEARFYKFPETLDVTVELYRVSTDVRIEGPYELTNSPLNLGDGVWVNLVDDTLRIYTKNDSDEEYTLETTFTTDGAITTAGYIALESEGLGGGGGGG